MLMPPLDRRHEHAHPPPLDPLLVIVLALLPQEGVARTGQHDNVSSRPMAMSLFVLSDRKFRQVRAHRIIDEFEQRRPIITAPFLVLLGLKIPKIGDEIGLPNSPSLDLRKVTSFPPPLV